MTAAAPKDAPWVLIASMDVDPEHEALFNEVYDEEHVPHLLTVPGVRRVARYKGAAAEFAIAGGLQPMPAPEPAYVAIYEIDDPAVLASPEWADAVEAGRWAAEVRPHTRNRRHAVYQLSSPAQEAP
jgi:hypothetical protein